MVTARVVVHFLCAGLLVSTAGAAESEGVDCVVGEWSSWSACDAWDRKTHRDRTVIVPPQGNGKPCEPLQESTACVPERNLLSAPAHCKPRNCIVTSWDPWSACDPTTHTKTRTRSVRKQQVCGGHACPQLTQTKKCVLPIDCHVSEWSPWSKCKHNGYRYRSRTVTIPAQHRGANCPNLQEKEKCLYMIPESFPQQIVDMIDPSKDPCEDLYAFACGNWLENFDMPAGLYYHMFSSTPTEQSNNDVLVEVLKSGKPIITSYFDSCMNSAEVDKVGIAPLAQPLSQIDQVSKLEELMTVAGQLAWEQFEFLVHFSAEPDDKDAIHNKLRVEQSSLTLDRSYYVDDAGFADIEQGFRNYIGKILQLAKLVDDTQVATAVSTIIELERKVATFMKSADDMDDMEAKYNLMTLDEVTTKYPKSVLALNALLAKANLSIIDMIVTTPTYFEQLERFLADTDVQKLKTWMKFQYVNKNSDLLSKDFLDARFTFFDELLMGSSQPAGRQATCVNQVYNSFPNLVGTYFAEKSFSAESEIAVRDMVDSIFQVMQDRLQHSEDWLDDTTRQAALAKLSKILLLVGHSDLVDVENLDGEPPLTTTDYLANTQTIRRHRRRTNLMKLAKPVNRREWGMSGIDVNAEYLPSFNHIELPAGILQPPLFNVSYLPVINYGATGATIGHELTHAFDPIGRLYDGDGNLKQWSTNSSEAQFATKVQCVENQYSTFELPSCFNSSKILGKVDGKLTLVESIADLGGVGIAFDAYQHYMAKTRAKQSVKVKREMDQLFYISFAQSWCTVNSDEDATWRLTNDYHPPIKYRVNGPLYNDPNFAQVFNCPAGSKMNPEQKCKVW